MDELDWKIVRVLQNDPDIKVKELGERIGLSHTPTWRRLKRLEEDGIVMGRHVTLNAAALGLEIHVFARVQLKQHDEDTLTAFEEAVHNQPEVITCYSMSGEFDYLLHVIARSVRDYEALLKQVLLHLPGVAHVNSSFALKEVKNVNTLPI
jgi:Lrp/AsnC family transcriptional regulator